MFDSKLTGQRLKALRALNDVKQEEVAIGLNITQSSVSAQELGSSTPPAAALYWYAQRYNVSVDYILGLIDEPAPLDKERAVPLDAGRPDAKSFTTVGMVPELLKDSQEFRSFVADLVRRELAAAKNQP